MTYEDYNGYRIYLYSHSYRIMTVDETVVHEVEGFRDAGDACDAAKQYIDDELAGKYEVTLNTLGRTQIRQFINGYAREDSVGKVRLTMAMIAHAENEKEKQGLVSLCSSLLGSILLSLVSLSSLDFQTAVSCMLQLKIIRLQRLVILFS